MTREKLMEMPIFQLRGLDIKTKEDELLVQEVLNEKLQNEPRANNNRVLSSEKTDRLTPLKEKELQAQLDGEPVSEPIASEPVVDLPKPTNSKFCEFCDSKGVRHKKNCTRLSANTGTI